MVERRQLLHPLSKPCLKPVVARERGLEPEDLPRGRAGVIEHQQTIAECVGMALRVPRGQVRASVGGG